MYRAGKSLRTTIEKAGWHYHVNYCKVHASLFIIYGYVNISSSAVSRYGVPPCNKSSFIKSNS